jgi:hypothetical protein
MFGQHKPRNHAVKFLSNREKYSDLPQLIHQMVTVYEKKFHWLAVLELRTLNIRFF